MVAVAMGDDGFIYRFPWVNIEIAGRTEKSPIGEVYQQEIIFSGCGRRDAHHASGLTLIHCNFRSIHFFDEVDLFILKIIEGGGFGIENRLNIKISKNFIPLIRKA